MLGGSKAKSMAGPEIADMIGENRYLALVVDEVANTRIVTRFDRGELYRFMLSYFSQRFQMLKVTSLRES